MRLECCVVAFAAACASANAQPLGTLLHSASERARIDAPPTPAARPRSDTPAEPPAITGFVTRSDGRATVFLDHKPPVHLPAPHLSSDCSSQAVAVSARSARGDSRHCEPPPRHEGASP